MRYVNPESELGVPGALSKVRKIPGKLTTDQGLVRALMTDPATAPLHGADRALIT